MALHAAEVSLPFIAQNFSLTEGYSPGRSRDALYEPLLADNEREAVADLLQYLENV